MHQYIVQSGAVPCKYQYRRRKVNNGGQLYAYFTLFWSFSPIAAVLQIALQEHQDCLCNINIVEGTLSTEGVVKNSSNGKDFHKLSFKPVKSKFRWGCGLLLLMNIGTREDIKISFKTHNILQLNFKADSFSEPLVWVTWPWFYWLNFYSSPMNNLSYEQRSGMISSSLWEVLN